MAKTKGNSFEARENKSRKRSSIVKMSELREENLQAINTAAEIEAKKPNISNEITKPVEVKVELSTPEVKPEIKPQVDGVKNTTINNQIKDEPIVEKASTSENKVINSIRNELEIEEVVAVEKNVKEISEENSQVRETTSEEELKDILMVDETNISHTLEDPSKEREVGSKILNKIENNDDFFNLNVKNDVFNGKITTVRVYDDILEKMKKYANMKNYQIIEFTNKVITIGLDDINNFGVLQISEIKLKNNTSRSIMYNLTDTMEDKLNKYIKAMNKKGYKISRNVILNVVLNETLKKFY